MLLQLGAHVNKRDAAKMTPIFYAVKYHHKQCMKALIEAGADLEITKPNGDTLIHEAAVYDSADCLIELAAHGLPINTKNNLMRTPIYIADKKRSKYAYQALLNLEKAIMMTNAYTERQFGESKPDSSKRISLRSSLKQSKEAYSPKKKVRIVGENDRIDETLEEENITVEAPPQELAARNEHLENLHKLISLRESLKSSKSSLGSFGRAAHQVQVSHQDQDEILREILEREKEEIRKVEEQLRLSQVEKQKRQEVEQEEKLEKIKRWHVIDQKRDTKYNQRLEALNRETDPFKIAEQLEREAEEEKHIKSRTPKLKASETFEELELSSPTDDEERERRMTEKEKEGKFVTFKQFLKDKYSENVEPTKTPKESEPTRAASKPTQYEEEKQVESEESEIDEELDFSNRDRSFDKHPLEISHDSKIEEEDIRMSKSTLRQIKTRKRSQSFGPVGRTFAYVDARSMAERGIDRVGSLLQRLRRFISENYESLKLWMYAEREEKKRSSSQKLRKRDTSVLKAQTPKRKVFEEEKGFEVARNDSTPKVKSIKEILKPHRTFGKTAAELIFEEDKSDVDSEEPSVILKRKIQKLKEDELKLKEIEKQIEEDLKELRGRVKTEQKPEIVAQPLDEQVDKKRKVKKGKKKKKAKQPKTHHDMRRMKQEHIKKMLQKDSRKSDESPSSKKIIVKDFKSDNDSVSPPIRKPRIEEEKRESAQDEVIQIDIEPLEVKEGLENTKNNHIAPKQNSTKPNLHNSPRQSSALSPRPGSKLESDRRSESATLTRQNQKLSQELQIKAIKTSDLGLKDYSSRSALSENKRYRSVERPRFRLDNISLPALGRKYSGSKYSLSRKSDDQNSDDLNDVLPPVSTEENISPPFRREEAKHIRQSTESEGANIIIVPKNTEKVSKFKPTRKVDKNPENNVEKNLESDPKSKEVKSAALPELERKNYDDIVKESLDFATFLKNQAKEINSLRDSDLSDILRVQKHVEDLVKSPKKKDLVQQSSEANKTLRQTLDFILSESEDSFEVPDEQELKESIIKFERQSLVKQSQGLLKSMRDAIANAKVCLSNNDFSNPMLRSVQLIKREKTCPEEDMEKRFGDELDDLIDEDFLQVTPQQDVGAKKDENKAVETLGEELNELYQDYGEQLFEFDDGSSMN